MKISLRISRVAAMTALLAVSATAGFATAQLPPVPTQPIVTVSASATATVSNDRLQAWLRAEAENPSAAAAASQVNAFIAKALAQMTSDALSQPACVHENQGRLVLADQLGQAVVNFIPNFAGHYGLERRFRKLDCQIEPASMSTVDDGAVGRAVSADIGRADKKARDLLYGTLGGG